MADVVGFLSLASADKSTWYSKHARMAVAYQLVLVHCGMTTVASSVVVPKRQRTESKCCTGGTRNPWGSTGTEKIAPDQCRLREFRLHICVRAVNTVQPREMPKGKLGVIRKVAHHGRQSGLKPRDRNYFLNCDGCT